jgi:hypothetical protein
MAEHDNQRGAQPAGQTPPLQPVDQGDEDRGQDGGEDQRDQQVADEPEQEEGCGRRRGAAASSSEDDLTLCG